MDFNSMKDQLAGKAKNELLEKVDEIKQDISKRFGEGSKEPVPVNQSGPDQTEAATDVNSTPTVSSETAPVEEATDAAVGAVEDVDSSPDADKPEEQAA